MRGSGPRRAARISRRRGLGAALLALSACAAPTPPLAPTVEPVRVGWTQEGEASWYGKPYHGRATASGETFDMGDLTAAHPTLPFGTRLRVTRLDTRVSVEVRINDRGPFKKGRIIDLSRAAAKKLDMLRDGVTRVRIRVVRRSS